MKEKINVISDEQNNNMMMGRLNERNCRAMTNNNLVMAIELMRSRIHGVRRVADSPSSRTRELDVGKRYVGRRASERERDDGGGGILKSFGQWRHGTRLSADWRLKTSRKYTTKLRTKHRTDFIALHYIILSAYHGCNYYG